MHLSRLISEWAYLTNPDAHPAAREYIERDYYRRFQQRSARIGTANAIEELRERIETARGTSPSKKCGATA